FGDPASVSYALPRKFSRPLPVPTGTATLLGDAIELAIGLDLARSTPYPRYLALLDDELATSMIDQCGMRPAHGADGRPGGVREPGWHGRKLSQDEVARLADAAYYLAHCRSILEWPDKVDSGYLPGLLQLIREYAPWMRAHRVDESAAMVARWRVDELVARYDRHRPGTVVTAPVIVPRAAIADLIVGTTLLEVKAVADPLDEFDLTFRQALIYALLAGDDHPISEIAIYWARHGVLTRWPLAELLGELTSEPHPIEDYRKALLNLVATDRADG